MRHEGKAIGRMRLYGIAALLGALALAGWLGYLAWTGRWAELDPVYATSAVVLLWVYTLLDARTTIAALRKDMKKAPLHVQPDVLQRMRDHKLHGARHLVDRHGLP